jgi:PAS domain-containing protein
MSGMFKLFRNLKIRTKLVTIVFIVALIAVLGISYFSHFLYRDALLQEGIARLKVTSEKYAGEVCNIFEVALESTENISAALSQMMTAQVTNRQLGGNIVLKELERRTDFKCIRVCFEQNAFDGKDSVFIDDNENFSNGAGQFVPGFRRTENNKIEKDTSSGKFYRPHHDGSGITVSEPEDYLYEGDRYPTGIFSVKYPIKIDNQCVGIIGADLRCSVIEKSLKQMDLYSGSCARLVDYSGKTVLYTDSTAVDGQFSMSGDGMSAGDIIAKIQSGKPLLIKNETDGTTYYHAFTPIILNGADIPWFLCISVAEHSMLAKAMHIAILTAVMFALGILLLIICVYLAANRIVVSVNGAHQVLSRLSLGNISSANELPVKNNDETGMMLKALNALTAELRNILEFAGKIGSGDYTAEYHLLSEQDELGAKMIEMRDKPAASAEKERQFKENEERRSWVNHGMAEFSDILRNNSHDLEALSYQVISNLVKYLNANQGGLFIVNNDDENQPYLELAASYAYERRKYLQKRIEPGEGLVGACYQEGQTIYMNDVPDGYIHITSGIGMANPKVLAIVPLKMNDTIYGIFEIASFQNIEPYQIDFLEKIGITTASTISTVKINQHTAKLLEQSQLQAQMLSEQEEEMRQNMEEMQATQEEMVRKNNESEYAEKQLNKALVEMQEVQDALKNEKFEIQSIMDAVDKVFIRITYAPDMVLLDANGLCFDFYDVAHEELIGTKLTDKMNPSDIPAFEKKWEKILGGEAYQGSEIWKSGNGDKNVWFMYAPIKDTSGQTIKIMVLGRISD